MKHENITIRSAGGIVYHVPPRWGQLLMGLFGTGLEPDEIETWVGELVERKRRVDAALAQAREGPDPFSETKGGQP